MGLIGDFFADFAQRAITWVLETTAAMIVVVIGWILDSPDGALGAPAMRAMIDQGIAVGRYVLPLMLLFGVIRLGAFVRRLGYEREFRDTFRHHPARRRHRYRLAAR